MNLSGLITPVAIGPLHSVTGAVGLMRTAVGMEEVQNPPAGLFEGDFLYAWQRLEGSDRFEMNLEIPAGTPVEKQSLLELSQDLRDNPPTQRDDPRCQIFDCAVDRLLRWFVALIEVDYRHIGLINPENIFIIRWSGWRDGRSGEAINVGSPEPRDTRVILPDAGFLWRPGGALPKWLTNENRWKFIWGDDPENVYRRTFRETWYLRVLARLLAYVLEPTCGVDSARGAIEPTALKNMPTIADAWKVLNQAISGEGASPGNEATPGTVIETFRQDLATKKASLHFLLRAELLPDPLPEPPEQQEEQSSWGNVLLGGTMLIALLIAALLYWRNTQDGTVFACCDQVASSSPIAKQLGELDKLRSTNAASDSSLPIRPSEGVSELSLILAVKEAYNRADDISLADTECLEKLLADYNAKLGAATKRAHQLLKGSAATGGIPILCAVQQDVKMLEQAGHGCTGNWLNLYRALVRRNRPKMLRECGHPQDESEDAGVTSRDAGK